MMIFLNSALARLDKNMNEDMVALRCTCGEKLVAKACRHIDATSHPRLEEQLLGGGINLAKCTKCGKINYLEEPLFYSNSGGTIMVLPRSWRRHMPRASGISENSRWTRTFYGLDALLSFIAAEVNAPKEYRDRVAEQAQMIADMYYVVGERRCKCGDPLGIEREFIRHYPDRGSVAIVKTKCVGCGEVESFYFPMHSICDEPMKDGVMVSIGVVARDNNKGKLKGP